MATIDIDPQTLEVLKAQAAAGNMSLEEYLRFLADADERPGEPRPGAEAWESFVAHMQDWGRTHLSPGHFVDDSRDSIYSGRGE